MSEPVNNDTKRRNMAWWQDWKWIAAISAFCAVVAFSAFVYSSVRTGNTVEDQSPVLEQLSTIAASNKDTLDRLDRNQAGIDELVAFVHEIQAQQTSSGGDTAKVVQDIINLLCSSSDPVRQEACVRLGYSGG